MHATLVGWAGDHVLPEGRDGVPLSLPSRSTAWLGLRKHSVGT